MAKHVYSEVYSQLASKNYLNIDSSEGRDDFNSSYVWFYDMEWMSEEEMLNFRYEDGQNIQVKPFARTSSGDLWGWMINDTRVESPVVYCSRDDEEGVFYAPSFIGAIYRHIFEFASENNFCDGVNCESWELDIELAKKHIQRWLSVFGEFMQKPWKEEVLRLLGADFSICTESYHSDYLVLISPDDANTLVQNSLKFDQLDNVFTWIEDS